MSHALGLWRTACRLVSVALVAVIVAIVPAEASAASLEDGVRDLSFEQRDLNGDAIPDMAILMTSYEGGRYRVAVYDQGHDMPWSDDWRKGTDFLDDTWLFQTESGEQTRLIIRFSRSTEGYLAELYDDIDEDGHVAYEIRDQTGIEVLESAYPAARMAAQKPWLLPGGRVNYMVQIATFQPWPIPFMQSSAVPYLPQDGSPSYTHDVVDGDANGIPDYELRLAFPNVPGDWGVFRSTINANVSQTSLPDFQGAFFWPYLGYADPQEWSPTSLGRKPGDTTPPIRINWQAGRIMGIAALFPIYGTGNQWSMLTTKAIEKNKVNELDWEAFAYYDFTSDTIADVLFRLIHQPVAPVRVGSADLRMEQVSYAWHYQNRDAMKWDYELELAALHSLPTTVVEFQDFALRTVPYEDLLEHFSEPTDWAYATFVAAESNAYESNEGIWEWGTLEGIQTDSTLLPEERSVTGAMEAQQGYLRGWRDGSPDGLYTEIREGFRGEYADLNGTASLYISPVDQKLHLTRATHGVWNLGGDSEVRYGNLDGDAYLDQWQYIEHGEVKRQLNGAGAFFVYSDSDRAIVKQAEGIPLPSEALPPRTREEWLSLGEKLETGRKDRSPEDLAAMLEQFAGPQAEVRGAGIEEFRLTDAGFRFVLQLGRGYSVDQAALLPLSGLVPGRYLVAYDGRFSVVPLAPPALSVTLRQADARSSLSQAPFAVEVSIENRGLEDARDLTLVAQAESQDETIEFARQQTKALAGKVESLLLTWQPPRAGPWVLQARVASGDGTLQAESDLAVEVTRGGEMASLLGTGAVPWWAGLLLAVTAALVGLAVAFSGRADQPEAGG